MPAPWQPLLSSPRRLFLALALVLALAPAWLTGSAHADNYSVAFLRNGLPFYDQNGFLDVTGLDATVGEVEVRNGEGNGIDGFNGHRQTALGPDPGQSGYGEYGFQNVVNLSGTGTAADDYFHGTFVAGIMASEYESVSTASSTQPFLGVAPLARYYGAVFSGSGDKAGFLSLNSSLAYVAITSGATVVNNSWGGTVTDASQLDGSSAESLLMDEYAGYAGKTAGTTGGYADKLMVIAAGNDGADTGLLGTPADCYNGLTVGALDAINPGAQALDDPSRAPADRVAPYSSWRPLANGRNGVDVVAPGTDLWSTLAINYTGTNGLVAGTASGTSFATPHVSGEAALLYGAAQYPLFGYSLKNTPLSTDHKLIKAIIINSADKIPGLDANGNAQSTWQPGLVTLSPQGVPNAIAPLNYAVGAGSVDANAAYLTYSESGNTFWDLNTLAATGSDVYYTFGLGKFTSSDPTQLLSGLTATLVWDRHVDFTVDTSNSSSLGNVTKDLLSDLDLILQEEIAPGDWQDIYMSGDTGGTVDQIYLPVLSGTGTYRLDVHGGSIADPSTNGEQYALAVSYSTIPEPGAVTLLAAGLLISCAGKRRRGMRPPPSL